MKKKKGHFITERWEEYHFAVWFIARLSRVKMKKIKGQYDFPIASSARAIFFFSGGPFRHAATFMHFLAGFTPLNYPSKSKREIIKRARWMEVRTQMTIVLVLVQIFPPSFFFSPLPTVKFFFFKGKGNDQRRSLMRLNGQAADVTHNNVGLVPCCFWPLAFRWSRAQDSTSKLPKTFEFSIFCSFPCRGFHSSKSSSQSSSWSLLYRGSFVAPIRLGNQ